MVHRVDDEFAGTASRPRIAIAFLPASGGALTDALLIKVFAAAVKVAVYCVALTCCSLTGAHPPRWYRRAQRRMALR